MSVLVKVIWKPTADRGWMGESECLTLTLVLRPNR